MMGGGARNDGLWTIKWMEYLNINSPVPDEPAVSHTDEADISADLQNDEDEGDDDGIAPSTQESRRASSKQPPYVMGGGARADGLTAYFLIIHIMSCDSR